MKVVYVAGPFRGANAWEVEQNVREAEEISLEIWRLGAAVICPHANTRFFQGAAPDEVWINGTMEILRRCDAVVVVRTAGKRSRKISTGTIEEIREALYLRKPVFYVYRDFEATPHGDPMPKTDWGDFVEWLRG